jgi:hypothetical protein
LEVFQNLTWFWTKLRVLVPYFPDFTKNFTKHPENRSSYVLIPLKAIRKTPTRGGRQQPHHSLKKFKKYKVGKKRRHTMVAQSSPNMPK